MGTFWVLLAVAGLLTYFYFKQKWNVLWAIITGIMWIVISFYVLANPPTGIVLGSFIHNGLISIFAGAGISVFFLWFRNKDNKFSDTGKSEFTESEEQERNPKNKSMMNMSETEYKAYLRSRRIARR